MSRLTARVSVLLISASIFSLFASAVHAQAVDSAPTSVQSAQGKQKKQKRAAESAVSRAEANALLMNARAQAGPRVPTQTLDEITVAASKTEERAIDALAPVSVITLGEIQKRQASRLAELLYTTPGVWIQDRGDDPSTSINIRGLQDFGRVAVVVDGARQNYQRTGHFANGSFFLDPELVGSIDIVRGPTANIYGSGAIGGVASFRTKDIQDVVRPGERWGFDANTVFGTNSGRALTSLFGGVHVNPNVDIFAGGVYRNQENYRDGTGTEVANTGGQLSSGIGKITVRPADGHEIKLGTIFQDNAYSVGQPTRPAGLPFAGAGTSVYKSDVTNYNTSLGWKYSEPDNKWFDWDSKIYWNRTQNDQTKTANTTNTLTAGSRCAALGLPGNNVTGCVGDTRQYLIDTYGFDFHNTTRFETGDFRHAFTYGADGFQDNVTSIDPGGTSDLTTPNGKRTVSGAFIQWKANYSSLLEIVSAARYDDYKLESSVGGAKGSRLSPKITVGLLPTSVVTPYVSYAEGYRAPSTTETLVNGAHAATSPLGMDNIYQCPQGVFNPPFNNATFCFLPNPNLRPEVGKTKEVGFNVKKNDIFSTGDSFRGKFNVFRNDVTDYIDAVQFGTIPGFLPPGLYPFLQYQNIAKAKIEGVEVETMYDAGRWFAGVAATIQDGSNAQTGVGLYSIAPQRITTTVGLRFPDYRGEVSLLWTSVKGNNNIPLASYIPGTNYELVNLYASFKATDNLTVSASVENLLDQYYRPYAVPKNAFDPQNDTLWASAGTGIVFKGGMKYHFGGL